MLPSTQKLFYRLLPRALEIGLVDRELVQRIRGKTAEVKRCSDRQVADRVTALRAQVDSGISPTDSEILVPACALVCEAASRALGLHLYDVQLLGGLALARGQIAEMQTGEGKTVVATLPALVHALTGKGVHVMTVNRYLADRDFTNLRPLYELLGLSVGLLTADSSAQQKFAAYGCDVTYGPGYEFGFDYLRDQLTNLQQSRVGLGDGIFKRMRRERFSPAGRMQRGHSFAVVDEADSLMIDEATTPLLVSAAAASHGPSGELFVMARDAARKLSNGRDYVIDTRHQTVRLVGRGISKVSDAGRRAAEHGLERPWLRYVEQAVFAEACLSQDVDYTVSDGEVHIVDKDTGRIFKDRSWRDGLHQAVQAKESVAVTPEQRPMARMTRQRFFLLYDGLCGMTGTTYGSEREFWEIYQLAVVRIPTHRACRREVYAPRYFANAASRLRAVVDEVVECHPSGRPVLVGTRTIQESVEVAERLRQAGLSFQLLNGTQDAAEADIVARAGKRGSITIATNMAGRGTDIRLEPGVNELGGLHVISCQRHETERVDRQLAGRAARQGDQGSVRFHVSADDELIERFGCGLAERIRSRSLASGEAQGDFGRQVAAAQRRVAQERYRTRRQLFLADDWREELLMQFYG